MTSSRLVSVSERVIGRNESAACGDHPGSELLEVINRVLPRTRTNLVQALGEFDVINFIKAEI
jgi:hypothetical protein